jgi:CubicO group peptidase (beta-lactamase class C family)
VKGLRVVSVVAVVAALAYLSLLGRGAVQLALGYSAKQYCSAVFVSRLPDRVAEQMDIRPRMAALGPLLGQLQLRADPTIGVAEAELLGARARAVHRDGTGCTLHGEGSGRPPLPMPEETAASPGVPAPLQAAFDRAFAEPGGGGRNTLAVLLSRHGRLLAERYAEPVTASTRLQGWSMNKSLMATWIGLQARRGQLDPAAPVITLLGDDPLAQRMDPRLTLLHLLQMESGLDFQEIYGPGADVTEMLYRSEAMWRVAAGRPQAYEPGSHFAYSSGDTVLASALWQRSLDEPYPQWLETHFQAPLGIDSLVAEADASGVQVGSSYAYQTGRDWLRTGQLWLDAWHGRSPLLDQQWLRESVAPRASDPQGRYGRGFWLNTGENAFQGMPRTLFYASGNAGQYVVVVPEWELVVVRLGLTDAASGTGMDIFLRSLAVALELSP